jgi:hypothetical protein
MTDSEIFERILNELHNINLTMHDLKVAVESSFDMLNDKLANIEDIIDKSRSHLESINSKK